MGRHTVAELERCVLARTADPQTLAGLTATALIVGLGQSTRAARETFEVMEQTTRALVEQGFRTVAVLDNQRVGATYDQFVTGSANEVEDAVLQAWGPWRTRELCAALSWIRQRNEQHPDDLVRVIGIGSSRVLPEDYDEILELVGPGPQAGRLRELFDVLLTAHDAGEHVQRAHGTHPHPERPFVQLARDARAIVEGRPAAAGHDRAGELLDAIVEHHANAIGVGHDAAREERACAERLLAHHRGSGQRIVLWEGSAHVDAGGTMLGSYLRAELGTGYRCVHVTFGAGLTAAVEVPAPEPGSLEDVLLQLGACTLDLTREQAGAGPWRTRVISGVYKPEEDAKHYFVLPTLHGSYDALAFVPAISPTTSP
jgi:erythromycin esterase